MTSENAARRGGYSGVNVAEGDEANAEIDAFEAIKLRLRNAFLVADNEYDLVSADDIRRRARRC